MPFKQQKSLGSVEADIQDTTLASGQRTGSHRTLERVSVGADTSPSVGLQSTR